MTKEQAMLARRGDRVFFCGRADDVGRVVDVIAGGLKIRWRTGATTTFHGTRLRSIEPAPSFTVSDSLRMADHTLFGWLVPDDLQESH